MSKSESRENHFVPQFYLRNFSGDPKRINLFNFSRGRTITGASIKHQCSRRNFYDFAPQLERAFAELEGEVAKSIRLVRATSDIPNEQSNEWSVLLSYIVFQKLRTISAANSFDAFTHYLSDFLNENAPTSKHSHSTSAKLRSSSSVGIPLRIASDILKAASDLKGHLFVNGTGREFITSDDPVVLHNQYCEGINYMGVTGWNQRGLQVFWPISPHELVFLYDNYVYKVGRSHRESTVTELSNQQDIFQLNSLQIFNAHNNIYFAGLNDPKVVEAECKALSNKRPKTRSRFVESESVESRLDELDEILHCYEPILPAKLRVSKISVRRNLRHIPLDTRAQMCRKYIPRPNEARVSNRNLPHGRYDVKKVTNI